jgi:hypothetical protein
MSVTNRQKPMKQETWATLVVDKRVGGRSVIVNSSQRGLFNSGSPYYNHQLKQFPPGSRLNVVIRLSVSGRRMIQGFKLKGEQHAND